MPRKSLNCFVDAVCLFFVLLLLLLLLLLETYIRIFIRKYSVCTNVQLCTAPLLQCEPRFLYYLFKSGTISYFFARSSGALSHSVKSVSVEGHIFPPNLVSIRSVFSHATQSASSDTFLFPPN